MKYIALIAVVFTSISSLVYLVSPIDLSEFPVLQSDDIALDADVDPSLTSASVDQGTEKLDREIDSSSSPELVLMKFGAPWCPPCRMVDKELRKLGRTELPVEIRKINVDDRPELASQYGISSIPRLILMQDGRKIGDLVGYKSAEELSDWIKDAASEQALAAKKRTPGPAVVHANPFFK